MKKALISQQKKIGEARWLKKAVEQRNKTILRVTSEIVKKQVGFFKHGFNHMKPMILKDISEAIGMHESTISRVTNSKIILTEWGAMSLKSFFSSSIANSDKSTEMHAASAVRETIKKLISSEITSKPLSDDKLADILGKDGMDIARRTVAKYRDMLKIPSSAQRRRSARLQSISN
jgi:RNA polymerase sigma-54 factor